MYNLLKNKRLILSLPLFLAASLFLPSHVLPSVNAQFTGLVCITSSTSATSCPSSPPTIGPLTPGSTFTVGVFVQGSDAMGGLDIYVRSDPAFVTPTSAALGTLIATPSLTSICINGSAQTGSCTVGTANGNGVVEVTTIESSGSNECGGISPCSGMAFTITYTVLAATPTTSLSYPTAPGCSASSVSSPPNVCVEVADSTGTVLPENIQGATINIVLPPAIICVLSPSTLTSCPNGVPSYPETFGSVFTVGVFVQGSAPLGGFDIYVSADTHYLNPTNASLGTLITSPTSTVRCVNAISLEGSCTALTANGPGVVEVSTFESSGLNDSGTGLAFTITYQVVGVKVPSTAITYPTGPGCSNSSISSPPNVCVLVLDNHGTTLPENIQGANFAQTHAVDPVRISESCVSGEVVGHSTTCTVIVNDIATSNRIPPISVPPSFNDGQPTWSSAGFGVFTPNACTLSPMNASASKCQVEYLPTNVGSGNHGINVVYGGDSIHTGGSVGPSTDTVIPDTPTVSTQPIVDQTGLPVNNTIGVPFGLTVHDTVIFLGGYPVTGATGSVTYTVYSNGACTGTGTVITTVPVTAADNVANSASVMQPVGSNSFNARYTPDVNNNNAVTSPCELFIVTPSPSFTAGKLHWTHHLSLAKSASTQSWTAIVANPLSASVRVVVRIIGQSTTNPTSGFDITCGVTCVNTAGGVNFTPGLTPVSVAAGTSSLSFTFNQPIPGTFANDKLTFTATLYWATGTLYTQSNSKSGAFAVVP